MRTFTVQGSEFEITGGKYVAASPTVAARRAGSSLFRKVKKEGTSRQKEADTVKFILRETTRGSDKKTYFYEAVRTKLATPKVIKRGGEEITVSHTITVRTCGSVAE
jgi:hypothetical protein